MEKAAVLPKRAGSSLRSVVVTLVFLLSSLAAGCTQTAQQAGPPVFYPPAPALPRIQFLHAYTGVNDVEEQSGFNRFIVGEKQNRELDKPYGVALYDGKIYVCDTNASVTVFDLKAKTYKYLKGGIGAGVLRQPLNISISNDGIKYVSDPVRGQVVAYDKNDEYLQAYGSPGSWRPVDAVPYERRLYVADIANSLIRVFDLQTGSELKSFGIEGEISERLDRPTNLAFDSEGYLWVTDAGRFQVLKFDRDGHFKTAVGKPGDNLGHFARPKGIAVDRDGLLYAVDASFNNVQMFNKDGRLLMFFGQGGNKPGDLLLPAKVAVDYDNVQYFQKYAAPGFKVDHLVVVISQFGERRVNVFGYGRQEGAHYPTDEELRKQIEERREKERAGAKAP